ncbi:MAG: DUF4924 family protein [Brumimicrobium sp.]
MYVAQEKLNSNIAEYVLYMYQLEDLIRGYNFDIDKITENLIRPQVKSNSFEAEAIKWYQEIIDEMKSRQLEQKGHLFRVNEIITELVYLHQTLKEVVKDPKYLGLIAAAEKNIEDFRTKSDLQDNAHLVEVCFYAMYMKLLMRLQQKEISGETENAFDSMRVVLGYLVKGYHQMKSGDMSMFETNN